MVPSMTGEAGRRFRARRCTNDEKKWYRITAKKKQREKNRNAIGCCNAATFNFELLCKQII
jgi:hypothetical protein